MMLTYEVTLKTDVGSVEVTVQSDEVLTQAELHDLAEVEAIDAICNSKLDCFVQR